MGSRAIDFFDITRDHQDTRYCDEDVISFETFGGTVSKLLG